MADLGDVTCTTCGKEPSFDCRMHYVAERNALRARIVELEKAIGVMVPTIIRAFIDGLEPDADVDRKGAEAVLARVTAAMANKAAHRVGAPTDGGQRT